MNGVRQHWPSFFAKINLIDMPICFISSFRFNLTKIMFQLSFLTLGFECLDVSTVHARKIEKLKPNIVKLLNLKTLIYNL